MTNRYGPKRSLIHNPFTPESLVQRSSFEGPKITLWADTAEETIKESNQARRRRDQEHESNRSSKRKKNYENFWISILKTPGSREFASDSKFCLFFFSGKEKKNPKTRNFLFFVERQMIHRKGFREAGMSERSGDERSKDQTNRQAHAVYLSLNLFLNSSPLFPVGVPLRDLRHSVLSRNPLGAAIYTRRAQSSPPHFAPRKPAVKSQFTPFDHPRFLLGHFVPPSHPSPQPAPPPTHET